jgi:hypothetical protein
MPRPFIYWWVQKGDTPNFNILFLLIIVSVESEASPHLLLFSYPTGKIRTWSFHLSLPEEVNGFSTILWSWTTSGSSSPECFLCNFCRRHLSLLPHLLIFAITCFYQYGLMCIYFITCIIIQYGYFPAQILADLANEMLSAGFVFL